MLTLQAMIISGVTTVNILFSILPCDRNDLFDSKQPCSIIIRDFFKNRFADFSALPPTNQQFVKFHRHFREADICAKKQAILEFRYESWPIFRITGNGIIGGSVREVTIKIRVFSK